MPKAESFTRKGNHKFTRRAATAGGLGLLAGSSLSTSSLAELGGELLGIGEGLEDFLLATDAYIYGYPLVTMEMTRRVITNVGDPVGTRAPMGQIIKLREYPELFVQGCDRAERRHALYDRFLRRRQGALGTQHSRYEGPLRAVSRCWTVGPTCSRCRASAPPAPARRPMRSPAPDGRARCRTGVKEYKSPTNIVWLLGRIYCTGTPEDYAAVHELQDEFKLVPLSSYGKPYTPPEGKVDPSIDMKTAVREQVNRMDAAAYFTLLCKLMKTNPPAAADAPAAREVCKDRHRSRQGLRREQTQGGFRQAHPRGRLRPDHASVQDQQGRQGHQRLGLYDQDRHLRHRLSDARARHRYRSRRQPPARCNLSDLGEGRRGESTTEPTNMSCVFRRGNCRLSQGFWSLTMYDAEYFFVSNPLNRYSISARQNLKSNPDGSTDLYIQKDLPGPDKESNWLPAPDGKFILMLRMYWPNEKSPSLLNGSWTIPPVKKTA